MPTLLTKRKTAWKNKFKPNVIKGHVLNPNASIELRYYQELARLIEAMTSETQRSIIRLFKTPHAEEFFTEDASISSSARILTNALMKKFLSMFAAKAKPLAESFASQSDKASSKQLHSSIQKLSGGLSLPTTSLQGPLTDVLSASVTENVNLIKSIPQKYLQAVQGAVMRSITSGNGLQDLVPFLAKHKNITERRARFIAMDQTRKAFSSLSRIRALKLGISKGEWLHTGGSNHPRPTHVAMTGQIFDLNKGIYDTAVKRFVLPGEEPGCRCRWTPVIEFGDNN